MPDLGTYRYAPPDAWPGERPRMMTTLELAGVEPGDPVEVVAVVPAHESGAGDDVQACAVVSHGSRQWAVGLDGADGQPRFDQLFTQEA